MHHLMGEQEADARAHCAFDLSRESLALRARRPRLRVQVDEEVVARRQLLWDAARQYTAPHPHPKLLHERLAAYDMWRDVDVMAAGGASLRWAELELLLTELAFDVGWVTHTRLVGLKEPVGH